MKIVISLSGVKLKKEILLKEISGADIIIAADGGYRALEEIGIEPHFLIGDMDSLSYENIPDKTVKMISPEQKDKSDSELAVDFALTKKPDLIVLVNAFGKRPDHLFSNLTLLLKSPKKILMRDNEWTITAVSGPCSLRMIKSRREQLFSIFPFGETLKGLSIKGFKYELDNFNLEPCSRGLSNVLISDENNLSISNGTALIFTVTEASHIFVTKNKTETEAK
ncbi:thiamine diphosphokinase [candidate division WOR-3 bacterium]|nr:thiamine diphosphokinase [candidate division WOR-3 bacterium]